MIKILLVSDLHLGLKGGDLPIGDGARIATFRRIAALARDHDLWLVGGDLFHGPEVANSLVEVVAHEFKLAVGEGVPVLYSPGEAELTGNGELPGFLGSLNATRVFTDPGRCEPHLVEKGGHRVFVYGLPALRGARVPALSRSEPGGFHIGLFHAVLDLNGGTSESAALVLNRGHLRDLDFDFFALGHEHSFRLYKSNRKVIGAYPGSAEATSFAEKGERYVLSLIVEGDEITQIKRLSVNSLEVDELRLDCAELAGFEALLDLLEERRSGRLVLRLALSGERRFPMDFALLMNCRKKFDALLIDDESVPALEVLIDECVNDDSLRGDFFSLLKRELEDGAIPDRVDRRELSRVLIGLMKRGDYVPEEWLC